MDFSNHILPNSNYISNKETSSFINSYTTFSQNKLLMIKNNEQEMENNNIINNNEDMIDIQNFYESQQQCLEDKLVSRRSHVSGNKKYSNLSLNKVNSTSISRRESKKAVNQENKEKTEVEKNDFYKKKENLKKNVSNQDNNKYDKYTLCSNTLISNEKMKKSIDSTVKQSITFCDKSPNSNKSLTESHISKMNEKTKGNNKLVNDNFNKIKNIYRSKTIEKVHNHKKNTDKSIKEDNIKVRLKLNNKEIEEVVILDTKPVTSYSKTNHIKERQHEHQKHKLSYIKEFKKSSDQLKIPRNLSFLNQKGQAIDTSIISPNYTNQSTNIHNKSTHIANSSSMNYNTNNLSTIKNNILLNLPSSYIKSPSNTNNINTLLNINNQTKTSISPMKRMNDSQINLNDKEKRERERENPNEIIRNYNFNVFRKKAGEKNLVMDSIFSHKKEEDKKMQKDQKIKIVTKEVKEKKKEMNAEKLMTQPNKKTSSNTVNFSKIHEKSFNDDDKINLTDLNYTPKYNHTNNLLKEEMFDEKSILNSNDNYSKDLNISYNKNSHGLKINSSVNNSKFKKTTIYERTQRWKEESELKIKAKKEGEKDKDIEECTFKPKVLEETNRIILIKSGKYDENLHIFDRNMIWKRGVDKEIQNKSLIQERKLYQECLFEPQTSMSGYKINTNETSSSILEKRNKNDYVYNKSIEWKNKVENKRRQKDLENIEKRIKDSVQYISNSKDKTKNQKINKEEKLKTDRYIILEKIEKNKILINKEVRDMEELLSSLKNTVDENQNFIHNLEENIYVIKK